MGVAWARVLTVGWEVDRALWFDTSAWNLLMYLM